MFQRLLRTKTFWAAVTAVVAATEQIVTHKATLSQGLQIIVPAVLALFLRDGVAKMARPHL